MSSGKNLSRQSNSPPGGGALRISEVAKRVGISSSALRAWEALGLVTPQRTRSRYRLYKEEDIRLLQRALFLRRARGLNPAAIVHILKRQGVVSVQRRARYRLVCVFDGCDNGADFPWHRSPRRLAFPSASSALSNADK